MTRRAKWRERCLTVPIPHPRDSGTTRPKALQQKDLCCPSVSRQRLAKCPTRDPRAGAAGAQAVVPPSGSAVGFVRPKSAVGFVRPKRPGKGEPAPPLPLASLPASAISTLLSLPRRTSRPDLEPSFAALPGGRFPNLPRLRCERSRGNLAPTSGSPLEDGPSRARIGPKVRNRGTKARKKCTS